MNFSQEEITEKIKNLQHELDKNKYVFKSGYLLRGMELYSIEFYTTIHEAFKMYIRSKTKIVYKDLEYEKHFKRYFKITSEMIMWQLASSNYIQQKGKLHQLAHVLIHESILFCKDYYLVQYERVNKDTMKKNKHIYDKNIVFDKKVKEFFESNTHTKIAVMLFRNNVKRQVLTEKMIKNYELSILKKTLKDVIIDAKK